MSLSSTTDRVTYSGNGSTTAFAFGYKFFADADLVVVVKTNSTGAETTKTITTHYTVSGAGSESGGTVTFLSAPASGETVIIYRDKSAVQELDITENGKIPSDNLEKQLDKLVMMVQRIKNKLARSVSLKEGFTASFTPDLPALMVNDGYLKTNAAGTAFEYISEDDLRDSMGLIDSTYELNISGTVAAPNSIVAGTGVQFTGDKKWNIYFITGSGGAVTVTANPRIAAGEDVGQKLMLIGTSDANYVDFADSNGVATGGATIRHGQNTVSEWVWSGSAWILTSTNGFIP